MESVTLLSIGVDIGSATTQLRISEVECVWVDTRYVSNGARVVYEAPPTLTPFADEQLIDVASVSDYIHRALEQAHLADDAFDTAFVVMTGLALERENARPVAEMLRSRFGRLSSIAAGDALECELAARGSGALDLSRQTKKPVLQLDVGGGTTKIILSDAGRIVARATIDVGGRLARFEPNGRLIAVESQLEEFAEGLGVPFARGTVPTRATIEALTKAMAEAVCDFITGPESSSLLLRMRHGDLSAAGERDIPIVVTGGVSEYVFNSSAPEVGDLGKPLGEALRRALSARSRRVLDLPDRMRATVIAAAEWTSELSGSTVYTSVAAALPLFDLPVLRPDLPWGDRLDPLSIKAALDAALSGESYDQAPAIAYDWQGRASVDRLDAFTRAVGTWHAGHWPHAPLVLIGRSDVARVLGSYLVEESAPAAEVVSVDGIDITRGDHVDIGAPVPGTGTLPVTMKTLLFNRGVELNASDDTGARR